MSAATSTQLLDIAAGLVLVTAFATLWLRQLAAVARVLSLQGFALAAVALLLAVHEHKPELFLVAALVIVVRGMLLPQLIMRAIRGSDESREVSGILTIPTSLLTASLLTLLSYAVTRSVTRLVNTAQVRALPLGVAVALIGVLLTATRRKAHLQLMGLLMIDNGITLVVFLGSSGMPLAVEFGIAADVIAALYFLEVLTKRIRARVGSTDLDQMTALRD